MQCKLYLRKFRSFYMSSNSFQISRTFPPCFRSASGENKKFFPHLQDSLLALEKRNVCGGKLLNRARKKRPSNLSGIARRTGIIISIILNPETLQFHSNSNSNFFDRDFLQCIPSIYTTDNGPELKA